eukprot:TRINITY_DN31048_c0_g1_i1.p1 TRINITY_DN31048_c0_g1~~TRINITY_DN31048_c0_g1_i1.p1  ORF type:complete len:264 (-),score=55.45 TRINITY_DN31048_c0_g1_i1:21-812(-)
MSWADDDDDDIIHLSDTKVFLHGEVENPPLVHQYNSSFVGESDSIHDVENDEVSDPGPGTGPEGLSGMEINGWSKQKSHYTSNRGSKGGQQRIHPNRRVKTGGQVSTHARSDGGPKTDTGSKFSSKPSNPSQSKSQTMHPFQKIRPVVHSTSDLNQSQVSPTLPTLVPEVNVWAKRMAEFRKTLPTHSVTPSNPTPTPTPTPTPNPNPNPNSKLNPNPQPKPIPQNHPNTESQIQNTYKAQCPPKEEEKNKNSQNKNSQKTNT